MESKNKGGRPPKELIAPQVLPVPILKSFTIILLFIYSLINKAPQTKQSLFACKALILFMMLNVTDGIIYYSFYTLQYTKELYHLNLNLLTARLKLLLSLAFLFNGFLMVFGTVLYYDHVSTQYIYMGS